MSPHETPLAVLVVLVACSLGLAEERALKRIRQAAEKGDAETQFQFGAFYHYRERNLPKAVKQYRKAAEQGYDGGNSAWASYSTMPGACRETTGRR